MRFELSDMLKSSCQLKNPRVEILIGIYHATNGSPCDGCGYKYDCQARHEIELAAMKNKRFNSLKVTETNSQIAKRLGISKRQVSKMRKEGKL